MNCPIFSAWHGGSGGGAAHRVHGLARTELSHFGAKMGQFILHQSEQHEKVCSHDLPYSDGEEARGVRPSDAATAELNPHSLGG